MNSQDQAVRELTTKFANILEKALTVESHILRSVLEAAIRPFCDELATNETILDGLNKAMDILDWNPGLSLEEIKQRIDKVRGIVNNSLYHTDDFPSLRKEVRRIQIEIQGILGK